MILLLGRRGQRRGRQGDLQREKGEQTGGKRMQGGTERPRDRDVMDGGMEGRRDTESGGQGSKGRQS